MNKAALIIIVSAGIALVASRRASAAVNPSPGGWFDPREYLPYTPAASPQTYNPALWTNDPFAYNEPTLAVDPFSYTPTVTGFDPSTWTIDPFAYVEPAAQDTTPVYDESGAIVPIVNTTSRAKEYMANLQAFLSMLRSIESNGDYNALVMNSGAVTQYAPAMEDHPANKGWPGVKRPDGRVTTAAGAYQILGSTWNTLRTRGVPLPDFTPTSQDIAAVAITQLPWRQGAYGEILSGNFDAAVRKLTLEWEAFDRILRNNYVYTLPQIKNIYTAAGGKITGESYA